MVKWWKKTPSKKNVCVDEKDAIITKYAREPQVNGGTGGNAVIGRPAAGKTGTNRWTLRMLGLLVTRLI